MNIIHVVSSLNIGGAERFVADLGVQQIAKGEDVSVVSFGEISDSLVGVCNERGISVDFLTGNVFSRNAQFHSLVKKCDVIHIHTPHALKALLPALWMLYDQKVIYTRHGEMAMKSKAWKYCHKVAKHIVHEVTFVSEAACHVFKNVQKWKNTNHHIIENGFDVSSVDLTRVDADKLRIGSVGRMVELKGQKTLLESVSKLSGKDKDRVSLQFFGDGDVRRELELLAAEICSDIEVVFHGVVTDRDKIYNKIDVLAVTSETEGLSLAMIEAMAYEIPVLATSVGGNPRLAINHQTGYLFEYKGVEALTSLISNYINDVPLRKTHGYNASLLVKGSFSLDTTLEKYQAIYARK